MAVEWFTFVPDRFAAVRFTGDNLDEIKEFAGPDRVVVDGDVVTILLGDEVQVLKPGWAVNMLDGSLGVTAPRQQESAWRPAR